MCDIVRNRGLGSGKRAKMANCSPIWPQFLADLSTTGLPENSVLRSNKSFIMSCNKDQYRVTVTNEVNMGPDAGSASITSVSFSVNTSKFSTTTIRVARTPAKSGQGCSLVTKLSIKRTEKPGIGSDREMADMMLSLNIEEDGEKTSVVDEDDFLDLGEDPECDIQEDGGPAQDTECAKTHSHTTTAV